MCVSGRRAEYLTRGTEVLRVTRSTCYSKPLRRNRCKGLQQKWIFIPRTCRVFLKWRCLMGMCQSGHDFQQESQSESIWAFLVCFDNGEMSCFDRDRIVISMMQNCFSSSFLLCYIFCLLAINTLFITVISLSLSFYRFYLILYLVFYISCCVLTPKPSVFLF